jgi:hypothetical protein
MVLHVDDTRNTLRGASIINLASILGLLVFQNELGLSYGFIRTYILGASEGKM